MPENYSVRYREQHMIVRNESRKRALVSDEKEATAALFTHN